MNKLELNDLKKLEQYSKSQIDFLIKSKNDLDEWAYPFISVKELKVIDKVLSKIKINIKQELSEKKENK